MEKGCVSILVPAYNNRYPLELCLRSILRYTEDSKFRIIVGDNGSQDGTVEFVDSLAADDGRVILARFGANTTEHDGVQRRKTGGDTKNELLAYVDTDYYLPLHSDSCVLDHEWLSDQMRIMKSHRRAVCVGAVVSARTTRAYNISWSKRIFPNCALVRTGPSRDLDLNWSPYPRSGEAAQSGQRADCGTYVYETLKDMAAAICPFGNPKVHHFSALTWPFSEAELKEQDDRYLSAAMARAARKIDEIKAFLAKHYWK